MKSTYIKACVVTFGAALIAGCGGGGGGSGGTPNDPTPPRPTNAAPTVSVVTNQSMDEGATLGPLSFTVGDAETDAGALAVVASSSDSSLISASGLELDGAGASRFLTVTAAPEGSGNADITITVTDASGARGTTTFKVAVNALLQAQFSTWLTDYALPRALDGEPVGLPADDGQAVPQIEDLNRIKVINDTAANQRAYDYLLPPPEPTEGSV